MKIAILGTGTVAQTLANVLSTLGYPLMLGTRQVTDTLHRKSFADWHQQNQSINIGNLKKPLPLAIASSMPCKVMPPLVC